MRSSGLLRCQDDDDRQVCPDDGKKGHACPDDGRTNRINHMLKRFYKSLFFSRRWYQLFVAVILLFVAAFGIPFLFTIAQLFLLALTVVTILDYWVLFARRNPVEVRRQLSDRFSNGDPNPVRLVVKNDYSFPVSLRIIDELISPSGSI
jgi:hypothetical protein